MSRTVVLVYPRHTTGWEAQPWTDLPLGLLCVAAPLSRAGYRVRVVDQRVEPRWRSILEEELRQDPVCVGVSTSTGPQLRYALEVSRLAKEIGNVPVVWGGVHPSILPEQTLAEECVDVVVRGEGEESFLDLVRALDQGQPWGEVPGLSYKKDGEVRHTPDRDFVDLNRQPAPAFDLIDPRPYVRTVFGVERLSFTTSRGCPNACTFCFNTGFHRRKWRRLDADLAVERIKDFVERCGVRGLFLTDSNFFVDLGWARQVLRGVVREKLGVVFTRIHICFHDLARLEDADFALLEEAGCRCLAVGVESGSARIRALLRKPIDEAKLLGVNRRLGKYPVVPLYFFLMGIPTETREDLAQTVRLFCRLLRDNPRASKSLNIYSPYPGTELFDVAVRHGLKVPERTEDWSGFNYRNLSSDRPWVSPEMRRLIEVLDFCSFFVGKFQPYKKTHPLAKLAVRLYAPLARWRVEHLVDHFPLELKLAKLLRLYGKQD